MPVATTTTTTVSYSRLSYVPTIPSSPDRARKKATKKENQFLLQEGSRLHAYARDKAPYPFSYDRDMLELSCLDNAFIRHLKGAASFINFKGDTPKRCLDLGTGVGDWVIDAAKDWTDCTFVGYDLVNVQMPLSALHPSVASRIQWVHGNLLRQKLPFEDDEFDHVHIHGLAFAVPETKWHSLLEEVQRVLRPGGTVEVLEEDAIFPILPKWFTAPLHTPVPHDAGEDNPESGDYQPSQHRYFPPSTDHLPHAHALLEKLFYSVFHSRFLNPTPTSMLPAYFSAFFSHVHAPPVFCFSMPPIAPMRPAPPPSSADPSPILSDGSIASNSPRSAASETFPDSADTSNSSISTMERARTNSTGSATSCKSQFAAYMTDEGTTIGGSTAVELLPICNPSSFTEYSLFMQLRRAVVLVMGLKEAMWEELKLMIESDTARNELRIYGWESTDFDEGGVRDRGPSRQKFEAIVEQYKSDMHARTSLWNTMVHHGWQLPRMSPLSKAERIIDKRLRKAIHDAKERNEDEEEMKRPCRSVRLLVGVKTLS